MKQEITPDICDDIAYHLKQANDHLAVVKGLYFSLGYENLQEYIEEVRDYIDVLVNGVIITKRNLGGG